MFKYSVIVKTGEAEIRAIEHTERSIRNQIFPLVEITRGRKVTKDNITRLPFGRAAKKEEVSPEYIPFRPVR